ncbi:hypothetical protein CCW43_24915 [Salmonella enterica]|nr:hypothetical protein [Salmonella enterica subsp. enterica serovar Panama]EDI1629124.1 hypothetical protein [Salmonella enterica]EDI7542671.1 hypothetical protein [Salmonella enterica]EDK3374917.1 hypothetical protein [Salmonella enterica subsp. enterica serovar Poona]
MLFKSRLRKMPVQHPDRLSQVPPGRGQNQEVVHVQGIRHMAVSAEDVVGFCQVEGGQQGAERPAPGDTPQGRVKFPAVFHVVVEELREEVPEYRGRHIPAQLVIQQG